MFSVPKTTSGGRGELRRQLDYLFAEGTLAGLSDGELITRFVSRRDEEAFAALVVRHGPMVRSVCRRWLKGDVAGADDAFQATFLVLVRRTEGLRDADRVGPWLYGVALRVAHQARQPRSAGTHQRKRERVGGEYAGRGFGRRAGSARSACGC